MPRPKRTKVTLAAARVAKPAPPKQQRRTTTRSQGPHQAKDSFSEDSDGLVIKSTTMQPRGWRLGQKSPDRVDEAELTMTGALPVEENDAVSTKKNRTPNASALTNTRKPRSTRSSITKPSPVAAISAGLHPTAASVLGEPVNLDDSVFDLTLSSFGSESPAHGTRPPSAIKVGATPAHEASVLALTNFKRRPRQPSLLRMVQQNTDVEDNDSGLDDTDNFDFDDFLPQAESTPLNVRKSAHDESRNDSGTHISSSGSRGIKRKLSPVIQVPRSSPTYDPPSGADVESVRSSSPSLPEVLPSHEATVGHTQDDDEPLSETYAPPMSSSPVREVSIPAPSPVQKRTGRRGRPRKLPNYEESDPEETETPAKQRRGVQKKTQQNISTAQLKNLLPRRKTKMLREEFDLDVSEVTTFDSDQDELQMPNPRPGRRTGPGKSASPKAARKTGRGKRVAAKPSRTYSRRISLDKENVAENIDEEVPTAASVDEQSEKLAAIRKKFEEVDKFQLEFEDVEVTTSSSPFR